jgi:alkanesulfonate monooxygenase SsuD/methylene tetrahydromethanopterin reductase-like flavin-dependent oxidoreductase (luciferase family)
LRFGVGLPMDVEHVEAALEYACAAEELGFDSVMTADHVSIGYEALTTLTAIAMKTRRLILGTLVLDGNRRDPAILAHTTATLDRISGGRLILGVGKGVFNEASYGFPLEKPVSRMLETIKVLKKLWTEEAVSHSSEFFNYERFRLASKPLQKPHPPIWIAAFGRRMYRIAARVGDGFVTQNMPPRLFERCVERAKAEASKAGRDPERVEAVYGMMPLAIARNRWTARKMIEASAKSFLLRHTLRLSEELGYEMPWTTPEAVPEEVVDECYVFGTPGECSQRIDEYVRAGATYIVFQSVLPHGIDSLRSLAGAVFRR